MELAWRRAAECRRLASPVFCCVSFEPTKATDWLSVPSCTVKVLEGFKTCTPIRAAIAVNAQPSATGSEGVGSTGAVTTVAGALRPAVGSAVRSAISPLAGLRTLRMYRVSDSHRTVHTTAITPMAIPDISVMRQNVQKLPMAKICSAMNQMLAACRENRQCDKRCVDPAAETRRCAVPTRRSRAASIA